MKMLLLSALNVMLMNPTPRQNLHDILKLQEGFYIIMSMLCVIPDYLILNIALWHLKVKPLHHRYIYI